MKAHELKLRNPDNVNGKCSIMKDIFHIYIEYTM